MEDAVQSLLREWPRPALENVAGDLGLSIWAVRKWHSRKRIPAEFWADLVAAAKRRGLTKVTLSRLAELHARPGAEFDRIEARA